MQRLSATHVWQIVAQCKCMISIIHLSCEVSCVAKFKIPVIPSTVNKSIRFPNDIVNAVETAIKGKECTFTAFVVEAVRVALKSLDELEED